MHKVCMLSSAHPALDTRIFQKEARTLSMAGFEVTVVAQHEKDINIEGINVIAVKKPRSRLKRMTFTSTQVFLKALKVKAAVYQFHDPELMFGGVLLRLMGNKVIYDVHEDYAKSIASRQYLPAILRIPIAMVFLFLERLSTSVFDATVTATDDIRKNFSDQKAVAVRNYPILEPLREKGSDERSGKINFIYVGGLSKANGISETVCAMEYLESFSNIKLILAGKFSPPEYEKEVRKLKGFDRVEYKGWISFNEIPALLASADAGIVCCSPEPNSINSLPNKMFEYMSAGLPVIASDFPLWNQIVEKSHCGLCVNPERPDEIAKAMRFMIDNPERKREMGENARKAVEEAYNWGKEAETLLGLYGRLVSR